MKASAKALLQRTLSLARLQVYRGPSAAAFLASRNVDLVIDVGANVGQYARGLRATGYSGEIHSFEPIGAVHEILALAAAKDTHWQVTRSALGSEIGEVAISVSRNTVFSSIKAITEEALRFDSESAPTSEDIVPITTLDHAIESNSSKRIFIKIDTQGFEQEVLAGAEKILEKCVGLQLELPISKFYENVWSIEEALHFMRGKGFIPAQIRPVNFSTTDPVSAVEFDCLFRRMD